MKFAGSFSANRVTRDLKIRLDYFMNYAEDRYDYSGAAILSIARNERLSSLFAVGLDDHWAVGILGRLSSSTYDNSKVWAEAAPGVEVDLFPYAEHSRRQLPIMYRIGFIHASYIEETIYGRLSESLCGHTLSVGLDLKELWGTVHILAEGSQYLHDLAKHRVVHGQALRPALGGFFTLDCGDSLDCP